MFFYSMMICNKKMVFSFSFKKIKEMEIFKSEFLKKEFDELVNQLLPSLNECVNCGNICCQYCQKFSATCSFCRKERCRNCCTFEISKEFLLNSGDKMS